MSHLFLALFLRSILLTIGIGAPFLAFSASSVTHIEATPLSPRTQEGRLNLQYQFELDPAHTFSYLKEREEEAVTLKQTHTLHMFQDTYIFEDEI